MAEIICSESIRNYFNKLQEQVTQEYEIATQARKKGFDPEAKVDILLAEAIAQRVEGLISAIAPQIVGSGVAQRIEELQKIYGPGDCQQTYGPVGFIRSILEEKKAYLFGEGTELRDHVFIRDVVQITIQLALSDQHGIYNLGTGQSDSFQKIIACLRKIIQQDFEVIHLIPDKPKVDQRINISKLLTSLPGFNFTGLEQGLQETYQQFAAKFVSGV